MIKGIFILFINIIIFLYVKLILKFLILIIKDDINYIKILNFWKKESIYKYY